MFFLEERTPVAPGLLFVYFVFFVVSLLNVHTRNVGVLNGSGHK